MRDVVEMLIKKTPIHARARFTPMGVSVGCKPSQFTLLFLQGIRALIFFDQFSVLATVACRDLSQQPTGGSRRGVKRTDNGSGAVRR